MPLKIRQVIESDTDSIWELHNRALEGTDAHVGNGPWDEELREPRRSYLDVGGEFLVALDGDTLIGMGAFLPTSTECVAIKRMRVEPSRQRQGVGQEVLLALESAARLRGFSEAALETTEQQVAAQRFYEANGYRFLRTSQLGRFMVRHYTKRL
jgi:ribosomal protein S18 acetylase RimI-like enzyme